MITLPAPFISQASAESTSFLEPDRVLLVRMVENYTFLSKENEKMETDSELTDKALKDIKDALECSICCEIIDEHVPAIITRCGHVFHTQCQASHEKTTPNVCPNCRSPMHPSQKFTGFTAIAAALKTLHDKRDAQCCTYTDWKECVCLETSCSFHIFSTSYLNRCGLVPANILVNHPVLLKKSLPTPPLSLSMNFFVNMTIYIYIYIYVCMVILRNIYKKSWRGGLDRKS